MFEFCPYCGAGIGNYRRKGEGTCDKCDNKVVDNLLETIEELHYALIEEYPD